MLTICWINHKQYFSEDGYPSDRLSSWLQDIACPDCQSVGFWRFTGFSKRYLQVAANDVRDVRLQRVYCYPCCTIDGAGRVHRKTHVVYPQDVVPRQWLCLSIQKEIYDAYEAGGSQQSLARHYGVSRYMVHSVLHRISRLLILLRLLYVDRTEVKDPSDTFSEQIIKAFQRYGRLVWDRLTVVSGRIQRPP